MMARQEDTRVRQLARDMGIETSLVYDLKETGVARTLRGHEVKVTDYEQIDHITFGGSYLYRAIVTKEAPRE